MIPILFEPKTNNFNSNGLGRLMDATSCLVTEERNGVYELEMQYPIDGILCEEIKMASVILAEPGKGRELQPFSVYKISKPLKGIITINAEHISYQLSYIPCSPFTAQTAAGALAGFEQHAAEECPYTFWTDKTTSGNFAVTVPSSIRSRLGGVEGSILDVYGGEFEFDRYTVRLWANRGTDNGVVLRYGKNITDLTQEENISNTITGIYPYWADSDGNLVELPEKVISSDKAANFPYPRTISVDFSSKFQKRPTEAELRSASEAYMKSNSIGVPSVSINVSFIPLWQTEEYKDLALLESVKLCDVITVDYEKLGVKAKAKIVRTVYDVLKGRYESLDVGDARTTLASTIAGQNQQIADKPSKGFLDEAVRNATNWITGVNGGYVVFHKNANGQPYEILIMDTDNIETAKNVWRWNQNGWGHSASGYNGPYTMAATIDGGIVADFITAGTMLANRIKGGTLTLGGPGNGNGLCVAYDILGNLIASISNSGILLKKGKMDIRSDNANENYIDLHWQYTYPSGTQYYRTMVSPRGIRVLIQDPDGTKRYAALDTTDVSIGRFTGSIDNPVSYTSDTYMSASGISDGTAYSGIVTVDSKRLVISGGLIRSVQ
ncbi:MAG: hypothetical protein HFI19_15580 [Lachnospiraceae bacterium]|nr:hypothetical protein [Lachnospiraceae bacterium]